MALSRLCRLAVSISISSICEVTGEQSPAFLEANDVVQGDAKGNYSGGDYILTDAPCCGQEPSYGRPTATSLSAADDGGFDYHASLFADLRQDLAALCLAGIALVIAASGGIGGGGILVPLYMLVLKFKPKHAIALSNITILGGAIANTGANVWKRHPHLDRPLIDWDLITIMEPLTIFGAIFGSLLSKVFPDVILNTCLVLVLMYSGHKTFKKGTNLWKEETARRLLAELPIRGDRHEEVAISEIELASPSGRQPLVDSNLEENRDIAKGVSESSPRHAQSRLASSPRHAQSRFHQAVTDQTVNECESDGEGYTPLDGDSIGDGFIHNVPVEEEQVRNGAEQISGCLHDSLKTSLTGSSAEKGSRRSSLLSNGSWRSNSRSNSPPTPPGATAVNTLAVATRTVVVADQGEEEIPAAQRISVKVILLVVCLSGTCILTVLKGGGHFQSPFGFNCGSFNFWLLYFGSLPWVLAFAMYFRRMLLVEYFRKVESGYIFTKGEVMWSPGNTIRYPAICAISGLFAGMFGVGGGIVKGPLMLEMGIIPSVAAASAATMVLFTSLAACVSFVVFGLLQFQYSLMFFSLGFICTVFGQCSVSHWLSRQDRQSPIVLSIGLVMLLSAALVSLNTFISLIGSSRSSMIKAHGVCTHHVA